MNQATSQIANRNELQGTKWETFTVRGGRDKERADYFKGLDTLN